VTSPIPRSKTAPLLEERDLDLAVAVPGGEVAGEPLEARERGALGRQEVAGAPGGAEGGHRRQV
jgi:hypothetical protein